MSRIRSKDTSLEKKVRSFLHRAGFRFRLHVKNLPGSPDIVLPKYRTVVFVHGCFWHRHEGCRQGDYFPKDPKQGNEFWKSKFKTNLERDKRNVVELEDAGWTVLTVWECETKNEDLILNALSKLIDAKCCGRD